MNSGMTFYFVWEPVFMHWLQSICGQIGVKLASFFTLFGEELILVLILGFIYWCYDKELGKTLGQIIVVGLVLNPMIKNVFMRRRPYFDNPEVKCLRPVVAGADIYDIAAQGFSFPSAHSMNSSMIYGSIAYAYSKKTKLIWIVGIVLPLLIGLSRVVVGVHYPTDVMTGWVLGVLVIIFMNILQKKIKRRWLANTIIFVIAALGIFYCETNDYFSGLGAMGGFYLTLEFEEKYVKFENTKNVKNCIFRIIGGLVVYLLINLVLKKGFGLVIGNSGVFDDIARVIRYFIVTFVTLGVYPIAFKKMKI